MGGVGFADEWPAHGIRHARLAAQPTAQAAIFIRLWPHHHLPGSCCRDLVFCMLLVCGYVLVGYGLFVVVYAIYFDTCKPVLQWTAAVVTVFRMVHANVVECFVVRDFFNIDRDASVRALEASFAESVDVFP